MPPFVNGFLIDGPLGDYILIATTENLIIFDRYYELLMLMKFDTIFKGFTNDTNMLLCCTSGYE